MEKTYRIENLCCAHCAAEMERAVKKIVGVRSATVVFMTQKLIIDVDVSDDVNSYANANTEAGANSLSSVLEEVQKAIRRIEPDCKLII